MTSLIDKIMEDLGSVNPSHHAPFPYYPPYIREVLEKHIPQEIRDMKKVDKIVIEGTVEDMNKSFEGFLEKYIPDEKERSAFKKATDALFMIHGAFQRGWKLGLKSALDAIEKHDLYEKDLPDTTEDATKN